MIVKNNKSGVAMHLVLATLMTLFAIAAAFVLNGMRTTARISAETKIKADYEMESALIMQYQKIKYSSKISSGSLSLPSQIIAPGLVLGVVLNRISSTSYRIKSQVSSSKFYKSISARVYKSKSEGSDSNPESWKIEYIKAN